MGIIEEKKKKKENDIMESALTIFKEKGIEKTSIRDIMTKSGYGLGTFYLYFKDKEDLKEKVVLEKAMEVVIQGEMKCFQKDPIDRYIAFVNYIMDYFVSHPFELDLISENLNWALFTKIENDVRLQEADSTLQFILNKYEKLFPVRYSEAQQLYILSLTLEIMVSTCKLAVREDSILTLEEMKPVLFGVIKKIFNNNGR